MPDAWRGHGSINVSKSSTGLDYVSLWMSIRLVAVDVDPEEGVMLQSDYIIYADTSDCLVSFLFNPAHRSPCTIRSGNFLVARTVRYDLEVFLVLLCTISISEPLILRYLVLGEFRSLST